MAKINVVGPQIDPLYAFLTKKIPPPPLCDWNFTKIIVLPGGKDFKRYASRISPLELEDDIKTFLNL